MRKFLNEGCMGHLGNFSNNEFDIAIIDPPYYSGPEKRAFYGKQISAQGIKRNEYATADDKWLVPDQEYFEQIQRISKHQIVWGCNYYDYNLGPGRIVWDKVNGTSSYSDAEIAFCSMHDSVRLFRYMWNGMMQGKGGAGSTMEGNKKLNEKRIHPTQKPVQLYKWLLNKYAKPDMKILDTHVGSASSLIAFEDFGCDYVGFEINPAYYAKAIERLKLSRKQVKLKI